MGEELQLLTNSRRSCFNDCPRKHYYMYELGRRPISDSKALTFGKAFHRAMELWWTGAAGNVDGIIDIVIHSHGIADADLDPYVVARLRALLVGYSYAHSQKENAPSGYTNVQVEREYRAPLVNPETGKESRTWMLAGKIDGMATDAKGQQFIIEHKTTSDSIAPESDYWPRLSIDGQVSGYVVGAAVFGIKPAYCLYDVIHKPGIKPNMATPAEKRKYNKDGNLSATCRAEDETPDEYYRRLVDDILKRPEYYFARREIVRMEDELSEYLQDMWQVGQSIRGCQLSKRWYKNVGACDRYGRCPYFYVCTKCASIEDDSMFVTVDNTNPELGGA